MSNIPTPDFPTFLRSFARIGLLSFGGPAAQISLMHRVLVDDRGWLSEKQFLSALSFCMLLPGPEAMQLATWAGWRLRGTVGGLIAGALFVLPGAVLIALLAAAYATWGEAPRTEALMLGIKATVIVIVVQAMTRLSVRALDGPTEIIIAGSALIALFLFGAPFPLVILVAGTWGWLRQAAQTVSAAAAPRTGPGLAQLALWAGAWLLPLPLLALTGQQLLFDLSLFFAKLAVMSFGGAYAVLAWMAQDMVQLRGWLTPEQMVDALGLAETTPGPLILVTQFAGQLVGQQAGGWRLAAAASALTLWMTFLPCFLWIFAFAPHLDRMLTRPRLQSALSAITAAVLGVIANLSLWFALHVFFAETLPARAPFVATLPVPDSLRINALWLAALAALLLLVLRRSVPLTLAVTGAVGWWLG
ncbi:chromate transporter [Salipiger aestuarii]|uniref:Chromate transporter n=1 Tax=Salipiger aestuarii TaxID=568098 RepID=A0A327XWD7_9RHOB|nr:chromate efflux transporter [Salipiger aestuarii]KAB2540641.1 chromate transporter [Salipiger aestuarii]RAK11645.1 chromate transporter [Salipiger aestuarii]